MTVKRVTRIVNTATFLLEFCTLWFSVNIYKKEIVFFWRHGISFVSLFIWFDFNNVRINCRGEEGKNN